MSFNCKLLKDITLASAIGEQGSCSMGSTVMSAAGIRDGLYVYNIEDIKNLVFEDDSRPDNNLVIDTIVTTEPYYTIGATSLSYSESYSDGKWTHQLQGTLGNILTEYEDILGDSVNGKYLVAFKPNGEDKYRVFGWKHGATLNYSTNISSDNTTYSITFEDDSEYPLFGCYSDNFRLDNKVYTPTWKGVISNEYCDISNGKNTGYLKIGYVVKVNSAGSSLDINNMLCQYSSLPQVAYKLEGMDDNGYQIIGTYNETQTIHGVTIYQKNTSVCPLNDSNTISVSTGTIKLNSTTSLSQSLTLTSDAPWTATLPKYCTLNIRNGNAGTYTITFTGGEGGKETITFKNIATGEKVYVNVDNNIIKVQSTETYPNDTKNVVIPTIVKGESSDYTISSSIGKSSINADGSFTISNIPTSQNQIDIDVVLTHSNDSNEKKNVKITIIGNDATKAKWNIISQFCED